MWSRSELKRLGKAAVLRNFWAAVAVCFLLAFIGAEFSGSVDIVHRKEAERTNYQFVRDTLTGTLELEETPGATPNQAERVAAGLFNSFTASQNWIFKLSYGGLFIVGSLLVLIFTFFVCHPVMVGARHFFLHNRLERSSPLEIMEAFHRDRYLNVVAVMFLRWLFELLWLCLLIVPGIVKAYEYRMIPYLLADNPHMDHRQAFSLSREMMCGQKWSTFVLDLSFILWNILSGLTFGLLSIFFLNPYIASTNAELYAALKEDALSRGVTDASELPIPLY